MASNQSGLFLLPFQSICRQCRQRAARLPPASFLLQHNPRQQRKPFSTTPSYPDALSTYVDAEASAATARDSLIITAAPPLDLDSQFSVPPNRPARIIPASPSYFTASPQFNDDVLLLRSLLREYESLPTVSVDQVPFSPWLKLATYRSNLDEPVSSSRYSKVLQLLTRLNQIHPKLQTTKLQEVLDRFRRPGAVGIQKPPPGKLDAEGRAYGVGRRKESSAAVHLVEGNGEVLVNGKSVLQAFPRLHDRESALWALKVTGRMDKYNVFALTSGGGITGQAESITLALGRALIVHEPALKPTLRKGEHTSPFIPNVMFSTKLILQPDV
ncbi:hypothetical protein EPUS_08393 [Endocarpon pusillum Z07020]|uniref:37S ribosomal protein S9 n=1 Tax=Endocarpon pusillum (strain Z07020 / HMAS-L-300199) TaxID=1263415 RepID=U1GAK0_ENDPU|nr:uncharacterized protein EPUS_08393 [Endocarpon pusillum Z07020]ERF69043.1 hypothetical protein EPUS_08393 [Endocarpon pusillum Z07020]